jgi:plastocyanin
MISVRSVMFRLQVYLFLALLGGRESFLLAQSSYREIEVKNGGTIQGVVRFRGDTRAIGRLEITKDANICGRKKTSPRLVVGPDGGVRNAVVFLEAIGEGKKIDRSMNRVVNQHKCEYEPHVSIVPFGQPLEIVNSDPILHNVHGYDLQAESRSLFNIAQPIKGQCSTVKATQFTHPGIVLATCDAGHPWMSAYIVVAEHPYYAVTDVKGAYALPNVPSGTYKMKMWHEGVAIIKTETENGKPRKYYFEEPYLIEKDVHVPPNGEVDVDFELTLR